MKTTQAAPATDATSTPDGVPTAPAAGPVAAAAAAGEDVALVYVVLDAGGVVDRVPETDVEALEASGLGRRATARDLAIAGVR